MPQTDRYGQSESFSQFLTSVITAKISSMKDNKQGVCSFMIHVWKQ